MIFHSVLIEIVGEDVYKVISDGVKEKYIEKEILKFLGECYFCKETLQKTPDNFLLCMCGKINCSYGAQHKLYKDCCRGCFYNQQGL